MPRPLRRDQRGPILDGRGVCQPHHAAGHRRQATFYVHGYLDQVGQATAGDPAHLFKLFGREIADAVREELLPP